MDSDFMSKICERLIRAGVTTANQIEGCSLNEISEIESKIGAHLPQSYKGFLLTMGHGAGRFFEGTDIFYPHILKIRREAEELLGEDRNSYKLTKYDFVFALHQGYQFMYFTVDENDDPSVYYYMEGYNVPEKKWASFSDFLLESVRDYERLPMT